jgi:hypothetical protein
MAKRIIDSLPPAKGAGRLPPAARPKQTRVPGPEDRFVITPSIREWIRNKILAWKEPTITWDAVRDAVRKKYPKAVWKRQSIAKFEELQKAFDDTKRRLLREREDRQAKERAAVGKSAKPAKPKSGTEEYLAQRVQVLEERLEKVEAENRALKQRFVRWQRNASRAGIPIERLDRELLQIDRGQADE